MGMPKVNASMLSDHVGKLVCLVGKITQVGLSANSLKVESSDQLTINISLKDQYDGRQGDFVQIIGTVKRDLSVDADKVVSFAGSEDFDLDRYNTVITKYLPKFSELFQLQDSATTTDNMTDYD